MRWCSEKDILLHLPLIQLESPNSWALLIIFSPATLRSISCGPIRSISSNFSNNNVQQILLSTNSKSVSFKLCWKRILRIIMFGTIVYGWPPISRNSKMNCNRPIIDYLWGQPWTRRWRKEWKIVRSSCTQFSGKIAILCGPIGTI